MKKTESKFHMVVLIALSLVMVSCSGNGTKSGSSEDGVATSDDQFFGDLPAMIANYEGKIAENKADQKKNTDLNNAFKLSQEEKQLKEEAKNEVEAYFNEQKEPLTATVLQEGDESIYKISELVLTKANFKNFMVKSNVEIIDPLAMEGLGKSIHLQIYKDGEPTKRWISLGSANDKTNTTWEFTGGTYCSFLVGVTKLVAKPDSVYKASIK
jgi:hypothetical protein